MLLGTIVVKLLGNVLTSKNTIRASEGTIKECKDTIRECHLLL